MGVPSFFERTKNNLSGFSTIKWLKIYCKNQTFVLYSYHKHTGCMFMKGWCYENSK